jgi:hypothetical protein
MKTFAFLTSDGRAGIPLEEHEIEDVENMRREQNHFPHKKEAEEEHSKNMDFDSYGTMKGMYNELKKEGFFSTYNTFEEWKRGERNLKKFKNGEWVD